MAEFNVHNVRFYDFVPRAIQCMAYENETDRLALSRADGSIEIWNCRHRPFLQIVLPASEDEASVEGLAWCNGRLFSVGLHGFLLEYDMSLCKVKSQTAITGGPSWCLALSPDKQMLAAGTEEGYVCLFDIQEEGVLYNKTLEKQEGRILSLSWHSSSNYIATGSINFVRLWSLKEGRVTRCSFAHGKNQKIIVWCVTILDNMTIISGDSRGMICVWNSVMGMLVDSVPTHKADVLCLATGLDQISVYVAGVDPTITKVVLSITGGRMGKKKKWIPTVKFRNHTHDIRALALSKDNKLFAGGVDTVLSVSSYPPKMVLKIPAPLYPGYLSVGSKSETLLLRYKEKVELWRLGKPAEVECKGHYLRIGEDRVKMLELQCKEGESIEWCALSLEGLWIAYIVKEQIKIFQFFAPTIDIQVSVRRVRAMSKEIESSRQVLWLTEGKLASVTLAGTIQIIGVSGMEATVEKVLKPQSCVISMACSSDGSVLVIVDSTQTVTAYDLNKDFDMTLPKYNSAVTAIGLDPFSTNIVIVYADSMIKEYCLSSKKYTDFCKQYLRKPFRELLRNSSVISNVSFDSQHGGLILLHDDASLIVLDKKKNVDTEPHQRNKIKRRGSGPFRWDESREKDPSRVDMGKFSFIPRSHQVLYFSHVKGNSLVSVELDPVQLHDRLPPTLKVKKYGGV